MSEQSARSILRIIAITTVLVGAVLVTISVFALVAMDAGMRGQAPFDGSGLMQSNLGPMAHAMLWGYASIILWGLLLFTASGVLSRLIVR